MEFDMRKIIPAFIASGAAMAALTACSSPAPAVPPSTGLAHTASAAPVQPETRAGIRAAASRFYALYAAGEWSQSWESLSSSSRKAVPRSLWTASHKGCPPKSAGLARVIKNITMAGSTAIVTETVAGALGKLGTVADDWKYQHGTWGLQLSANDIALYSKGTAAAVIAAAKAEGICGSSS
jgi:hypothetical protein